MTSDDPARSDREKRVTTATFVITAARLSYRDAVSQIHRTAVAFEVSIDSIREQKKLVNVAFEITATGEEWSVSGFRRALGGDRTDIPGANPLDWLLNWSI